MLTYGAAPCCHKEVRAQLDAAGAQKDGGVVQVLSLLALLVQKHKY
jgi:hypothetical protein